MSNSKGADIHNWFDKMTEALIGDLSQQDNHSNSCVFLDSKTINLLIIYMMMNKEMEISKKNMHQGEQLIEIEKEIDALIAENNQQFKELIKEAKKRS
ncbi:hypothetical protein NCCP2716_14480 [Sporosarcina sp. NCCP-2716]|uniref:hypothetical protein n=1 Tax=Sporosarcina sp. NCCP-2716 TaxID=2943679 RepID=UPI0020422CB8|nr:hypothetical protein [Sporosarcina sp. NCCP-2716]GKV68950.1 hypothetical protein NCCP2716_14480 [Sporosarcina sp. NCCP-2716]